MYAIELLSQSIIDGQIRNYVYHIDEYRIFSRSRPVELSLLLVMKNGYDVDIKAKKVIGITKILSKELCWAYFL